MQRRASYVAGRLRLAVGPRQRVVEAEGLGHPVAEVRRIGGPRREPADVDPGQVVGGLAAHDPLRQRATGPSGGGDADRVEARADEVVVQLRRPAQDELVVGRERLRPVVELPDAGLGQHRDAAHRLVHEHREVLPVLLEQLELERVGQVVGRPPGLRLRLETADDQAADLLLEVGPAVRVAHDRQVGMGALDRLGHDVEVLARVQRHGHSDQVPQRLGPLAAAVDDEVALDGPLVGLHGRDPAPVRREPGHPHLLGHPGAALPRALGQRLGEVGGVDLAVTGQPQRAEQVVDLHHRPELPGALGRDQLAVHVVRRGVGRCPPELDHPLLGARHDHPADVAVAGRQPGLGLERGVELRGVLHQPGAALRGAQRSHQPGRVPRRTAREVALLEQQHVGAGPAWSGGRRRTPR